MALNIRGNTAIAAGWLVHHDARVWQRDPVAFVARGEEQRAHACGLTDADS